MCGVMCLWDALCVCLLYIYMQLCKLVCRCGTWGGLCMCLMYIWECVCVIIASMYVCVWSVGCARVSIRSVVCI